MTLVVYAAPATEPLSASEVMAYCRIDAGNVEPAPGAVTAALAGAAGNIDNGVHRYLATFVTATGETQAGAVSAAVTVVDKTTNGQVSLTGIPVGGTLVTSRKLYRTAAGGSTYMLLATISNNTATTYTDNVADASLGAGAPSANTTSDPLLAILIASARAAAETELHRYLVTQTLDAYFDRFPCYPNRIYADFGTKVPIKLPPLTSVTSITYIDSDGVTQILPTDQYVVDAKSQPAQIAPAYGCYWPSVREQKNAVVIRFVAGYGTAAEVPACIKNWMLLRIKTLWENRDQVVVGTNFLVEFPPAYVDSLLDPERVSSRA